MASGARSATPAANPRPTGERPAERGLPALVVDLPVARRGDCDRGPHCRPGQIRRRPGRLLGRLAKHRRRRRSPAGDSQLVPGGTLHTYDKNTRRALEQLDGHVDVELAREIWADALDARWDGADRWFHGDVAEGNLLLKDGQLAAVIDFGTCGVGDLACDLAIAWTLLTADSRQAFRDRLPVDAASWRAGVAGPCGRPSRPVCIHARLLRTRKSLRARNASWTRSSLRTLADGRPRRRATVPHQLKFERRGG